MSRVMKAMTDLEKHEAVVSFKKKYGKRPQFKKLFNAMQRGLYRDDVLQPYEAKYKQKWYPGWKAREAMHASIEREEIQKQKDLEILYRQKAKRIITREEKILRDLHKEHPKMTSEEDIIRWQQ